MLQNAGNARECLLLHALPGLDLLCHSCVRSFLISSRTHVSKVQRLMIATPRGTVTLKSFFSVSLASDDNEAGTSAASVRHLIGEIVRGEVPGDPLSYDEIVSRINASGIAVARRTVAKYRQILKIPSSAERRRRARLNAPA